MTSEPLEVRTYQFYSEASLPAPQHLKSLHAQRHIADPEGIVRLIFQYEDGRMDVKFCRRIGNPNEQGFYKWGAFPTKEVNYARVVSWDIIDYFERGSPEAQIFEMLAEQAR